MVGCWGLRLTPLEFGNIVPGDFTPVLGKHISMCDGPICTVALDVPKPKKLGRCTDKGRNCTRRFPFEPIVDPPLFGSEWAIWDNRYRSENAVGLKRRNPHPFIHFNGSLAAETNRLSCPAGVHLHTPALISGLSDSPVFES